MSLKPVRDGKLTPLVCPDCGCRLNFVTLDNDNSFAHHFASHSLAEDRDARGCICPSVGVVWNVETKKIQHLTV